MFVIIIGHGLTLMTVSLYKNLVINMVPTPTKVHYIFNLKDVSKVMKVQMCIRNNLAKQ